jgi:hypothetical protein
VHRSQEWSFERPSPILWGSFSGWLGAVPCADAVGVESASNVRGHDWDG